MRAALDCLTPGCEWSYSPSRSGVHPPGVLCQKVGWLMCGLLWGWDLHKEPLKNAEFSATPPKVHKVYIIFISMMSLRPFPTV